MTEDAAMFKQHNDTAQSVAPSILLTEEDIERFWSKVEIGDGCWEWKAAVWKSNGYGCFTIKSMAYRAHRISYQISYGNTGGFMVLHRCDNRSCVRPDHLFLGTHKENMRDMAIKKRAASGSRHGTKTRPESIRRGEMNGNKKLNKDQIFQIRALAGTVSFKKIALMFNVSGTLVSKIVTRKVWRHI